MHCWKCSTAAQQLCRFATLQPWILAIQHCYNPAALQPGRSAALQSLDILACTGKLLDDMSPINKIDTIVSKWPSFAASALVNDVFYAFFREWNVHNVDILSHLGQYHYEMHSDHLLPDLSGNIQQFFLIHFCIR